MTPIFAQRNSSCDFHLQCGLGPAGVLFSFMKLKSTLGTEMGDFKLGSKFSAEENVFLLLLSEYRDCSSGPVT